MNSLYELTSAINSNNDEQIANILLTDKTLSVCYLEDKVLENLISKIKRHSTIYFRAHSILREIIETKPECFYFIPWLLKCPEFLLHVQHENFIQNWGFEFVEYAYEANNIEFVNLLLDLGIQDGHDSVLKFEGIRNAVRAKNQKHIEILVDMCINGSIDNDVDFEFVLQTLVFHSKWNTLTCKLINHLSFNGEGKDFLRYTTLRIAIKSGNIKIIKNLIDNGASLEGKKNDTPSLFLATLIPEIKLCEDMISFLLSFGADINILDHRDNTILHHLAQRAGVFKYEIIEHLLLLMDTSKISQKNKRDETFWDLLVISIERYPGEIEAFENLKKSIAQNSVKSHN
jgi:hypothetical protein